jgi:tetratricopeptide (TPR) repeat protein
MSAIVVTVLENLVVLDTLLGIVFLLPLNIPLGRGWAYYEMSSYDDAITDFGEAIKLDSRLAGAFYSRGVAYYDKRNYDRAIADFNEAIKLDPNYAGALYARGRAKREKGDRVGASADIAAATAINPNVGK